jgi:hypothetical protein
VKNKQALETDKEHGGKPTRKNKATR